jgi:hypothetical protein
MFYQERTDNRVSMIHLNPVTTGKHCVKRGLFLTDNDLYKELTHQNFKTILLTNATTDEGEDDVAKYFKVQKQWNELLFQWKEEGKVVIGFKQYCKTNTTLALVVLTWLPQIQEYFYKIGDANENGDWNIHRKYCPVKAKHMS